MLLQAATEGRCDPLVLQGCQVTHSDQSQTHTARGYAHRTAWLTGLCLLSGRWGVNAKWVENCKKNKWLTNEKRNEMQMYFKLFTCYWINNVLVVVSSWFLLIYYLYSSHFATPTPPNLFQYSLVCWESHDSSWRRDVSQLRTFRHKYHSR